MKDPSDRVEKGQLTKKTADRRESLWLLEWGRSNDKPRAGGKWERMINQNMSKPLGLWLPNCRKHQSPVVTWGSCLLNSHNASTPRDHTVQMPLGRCLLQINHEPETVWACPATGCPISFALSLEVRGATSSWKIL